MTQPITLVTSLLFALLLGGCASGGGIDTHSAFSRDVDYSTLRTYRITTSSDLPPAVERMIEAELHTALAARGLRPTDDGALEINYYAAVHDQTRSVTVPEDVFRQYRTGYHTWPDYQTHLVQVTDGTLFVDLIDAADRTLIWEGNARGALKRGQPERNRQRVARAIEALLADFPPGTGR